MIYYIFPTQIFSVFLSMAHITAITFPSKVQDYIGGVNSDFKVYELNKGKTLVYEPKSKNVKRNLIIFLKKKKYHFDMIYNETLSNKDIEIKQAKPCNKLNLIKETVKYQLFSCPKSLLFINKSKMPVKINHLVVKDRKFLSKGPLIVLDSKKIYYQGVAF